MSIFLSKFHKTLLLIIVSANGVTSAEGLQTTGLTITTEAKLGAK